MEGRDSMAALATASALVPFARRPADIAAVSASR